MPQSRDPRTSPPAYLGEKLRRARLAAGFTSQDSLGARLLADRSTIGKAETGERVPTPELLAAWCEVCGLDLALYIELSELARAATGPVPSWFQPWVDIEDVASSLRIWQPLLIPGLVQTRAYARELFLRAQTDTSDEAITALTDARMARQAVLDREEPPDVVIVIDESVLYRLIGTAAIMREACNHLAELAGRPNVVVQVVPADIGGHGGLGGGYDIASGDGIPATLRQEGLEDQTSQVPALVRKAAANFDRVRGDAMPRGQSRETIEKAAERWNTTQ